MRRASFEIGSAWRDGCRGAVAELVGIEVGVVSGVIKTSNHPALKRRTGDHAMTNTTTKSDSSQPAAETTSRLFDNWFDPIETEVRARARQFDLLPCLPSFISRACSGSAPEWGGLQTQSV